MPIPPWALLFLLLLGAPAASAQEAAPATQGGDAPAQRTRPDRAWSQFEVGIGAAIGEEFPGFGIGSGLAFETGLRFGLKNDLPIQVGTSFRGIIPENRIFLRDASGAVERLLSSEAGVDWRVIYARITSPPGALRAWVEPGLAMPFWEIHRTATSIGAFRELGGWFGVWLGGNLSGGIAYHKPKFAAGIRSGISVGGLIGNSGSRFGFGPWLTNTPAILWWHGPILFFQFDLKMFPAVRIDISPVEVVAFIDPQQSNGVTVPDRYTHMSIRLVLELPFGPQPPDFDLR